VVISVIEITTFFSTRSAQIWIKYFRTILLMTANYFVTLE